jgi:hypothetical protein
MITFLPFKKWFVFGFVGILVFAFALTNPLPIQAKSENPFVGTWELVSFESRNRETNELTVRPMEGRISYDADGNMAAQLMPLFDAPAEERRNERYMAYYGTVDIDQKAQSVTHHVLGSNLYGWIGTDLVRYYETDKQGQLVLVLRNDEGKTTTRLVWKRTRRTGGSASVGE